LEEAPELNFDIVKTMLLKIMIRLLTNNIKFKYSATEFSSWKHILRLGFGRVVGCE
jgi:hypothetical protein